MAARERRRPGAWFWMTLSLNSVGRRSSGFFLRWGESWGGGVEKGVKARWENVLCDGRVSGDKRGNGLRLVLHWADRPLFVSHLLVRRPCNFHSFFYFFLSLSACPTWVSFPALIPPLNNSAGDMHGGKLYSLWCCKIGNFKKWGFMKSYYNIDLKLLWRQRHTTSLSCT